MEDTAVELARTDTPLRREQDTSGPTHADA
jgi:hypothetical protein